MRFAWPVPGQARVFEEGFKNGRHYRARFRLHTASLGANDDIEVRFAGFELIDIEGMDIREARVLEQLAPQIAMMSALPRFRVARSGELIAVEGIEEILRGLLDNELFRNLGDPAVRQRVEALMFAPTTLATIEASSASYWNAWVGFWLRLPPRVDGITSWRSENVAFGQKIPFDIVLEPLAVPAGSAPGRVRYRMRSIADGDAIKQALGRFLEKMSSVSGGSSSANPTTLIESVAQSSMVEIVTDPRTLQPDRVEVQALSLIKLAGQPARQTEQRNIYSFQWD
ncbi:MAG: hypothetical protein KDK91_26960 [Gammaproteobacteria bacterium]|nr:hypothetical protein [Gammaproteobacteria bacterium]